MQKMSVRHSSAATFSLRDVDSAAVCGPLLLSPASEKLSLPLGQTNRTQAPARSLKFDFSSLQRSHAAELAPAAFQQCATQVSAVQLKAAFHGRDSSRADVLRLTAVVDELSFRQKKTAEKAAVAEAQLHKVSQALLGERNSAGHKIKSLSAELKTRHQMEVALRAEVSKLQQAALAVVPRERLDSAVGSALIAEKKVESITLELEEVKASSGRDAEKNIALTEKNTALTEELVAMHAEHKRVTKELEELEVRHSSAIVEARVAREEAAAVATKWTEANAKLEAARAHAEEAERRVAEAERFAAAAEEKTATHPELQAALEAARGRAADVEAELGGVKQELALAAAELDATKKVEVKTLDPIAMHGTYQQLRGRVMRLSAAIAAGGEDTEETDEMTRARDELLSRASTIKQQYEQIFGAAEAEAEALSQDIAREIVRKEVVEAAEPVVKVVYREEARPRSSGALPTRRLYADSVALRAAVRGAGMGVSAPAMQDCCGDVGSVHNLPISAQATPVDKAVDTPSSAYVSSVITDLSSLMKIYTGDGAAVPAVV
tara:strand:+ start:239 stop:1891 length:1653 start_codon:yes stop_codon:yes gene_type:complete